MTAPLLYLHWSIFARKSVRFFHSMRRPSTFIGVASLAGLGTSLVYVSDDQVFDRLFQPGSLAAFFSFWLIACFIRGLWQRGVIFQPSDMEFLIPGPFRPSELIGFRLLPAYVGSLFSGLAFLALVYRRFASPGWISAQFILFQIVCAHLAVAASWVASKLSSRVYVRTRRLMVIGLMAGGVISLNTVLPLAFIPARASRSLGQLGRLCAQPVLALLQWSLAHPLGGLAALSAMAVLGWIQLRWLGFNFIESSILRSEEADGNKLSLTQAGFDKGEGPCHFATGRLWFNGAGSIVWRLLLTALRRQSDLFSAALVTIAYVGAVKIALDENLIVFAQTMATGRIASQEYSEWQTLAVKNSVLWIGFLGLLLQRILPFDFRTDGRRIADLRLLPISPTSIVLAEIVLQVGFCLSFQSAAVGFFWLIGTFPQGLVWLSVLAFIAIDVGVACTGDMFALCYSGRVGDSNTGVLSSFLLMALVLVALSPGIGAYMRLSGSMPPVTALIVAIGMQSLTDFGCIIVLSKMFSCCELSRELQ